MDKAVAQQEPTLYDEREAVALFKAAQAGSDRDIGMLRGIRAVLASWESRPNPHEWLVGAKQPQQEPVAWADMIMGIQVSMDVSTGDDDAQHRVFGRVSEVMLRHLGSDTDVICAIEESRNFDSVQRPASEVRYLRKALSLVRQYPDFDQGGPLPDMIDQVLRGERSPLLDSIDPLAHGFSTARDDTALLRQALEALEQHTAIKHPQQRQYRDAAIAALKERLS